MRICPACKTANEPGATACSGCAGPLSERDHHIVVEPGYIDDLPSLEGASRFVEPATVRNPEPVTPNPNGAGTSTSPSISQWLERTDPVALEDHLLVEPGLIDDIPPLESVDVATADSEIPRPPTSAIRPYARDSSKRPASLRIGRAALLAAFACVALIAIVPFVVFVRKHELERNAIVTRTPVTLPPRRSLPNLVALRPKPAVSPRRSRPSVRPHAKPRPLFLQKHEPKSKRRPISKATPLLARKPRPARTIVPKRSVPKPRLVTIPTSLTSPRVKPVKASATSADQPLVIRSMLGRSGTLALATGRTSEFGDVRWHRLSAAQWQLVTLDGAFVHRLGPIGYAKFFAITQSDLASYSYERNAFSSISGSDLDGTVLAVHTNDGSYAKVYVQEADYQLTLYYNLYAAKTR